MVVPEKPAFGVKVIAPVTASTVVVPSADAVVIVTEWDAFRALDLDRVKKLAKAPVLVDLRNVYDPAEVRAKGFHYTSIGRP